MKISRRSALLSSGSAMAATLLPKSAWSHPIGSNQKVNVALGCIAQRLGGELEFDRASKQITNSKAANALLQDEPRKGWEQYYAL